MKQISVLIVEDSKTQSLQIQHLLEKQSYRVLSASDGEEGLEILEKELPDVIISDIVMPKIDGYELCKRVKSNEKTKDIPVILLTNLSEPEDIIKGLDCGANRFLTKPCERGILISSIQYVLSNRDIRLSEKSGLGMEIFFGGKKHFINSDRMQILDLLFSSYEDAVEQKKQLEKTNKELSQALETIKQLKGIIPICSYCKKIRNDTGYWDMLEAYIEKHSDAQFSHGICPDCEKKLMETLIKK